jgi:hypothetical protein
VWRCRLRDLTVVFLLEELRHYLGRSLAFSNLEHGPDQETDHVVKKPISRDVEYESAVPRPFAPACARNDTPMVVPLGGGAFDRECPEAMLSLDGSCGGLKAMKIERFPPDQLMRPAKRGRCEIVCAYVVAVAARNGAIAGVKLVTHFEGCRNPYIVR